MHDAGYVSKHFLSNYLHNISKLFEKDLNILRNFSKLSEKIPNMFENFSKSLEKFQISLATFPRFGKIS